MCALCITIPKISAFSAMEFVLTPPSISAVSTPVLTPPSIRAVSTHKLTSQHSHVIGFGEDVAIMADTSTRNLVRYKMSRKEIEKLQLNVLQKDCGKYVLADGKIILGAFKGSNTTNIYSDTLNLLKTYNGYYGRLIGALPPDLLVYVKKSAQFAGLEIHVYSVNKRHQFVMKLHPKKGTRWSESLSVCMNPQSGDVAVAGYSPNILDVFDKAGK